MAPPKVNNSVFSERELMFTFAICCRPSVCLSSVVCNARAPYSDGSNFLAIFLRHLVPWPSIDILWKFHGDHPMEPLRHGS